MKLPPTCHPLPDEYAEAAYRAAYENAVQQGEWEPAFTLGLEFFARVASQYLEMAWHHPSHPEIDDIREVFRDSAYDWGLVETALPPPLRPDGLDPDLARICGLDRHLVH